MNFIFISPQFPHTYWSFCDRLHRNGVNVLGIGDSPYDSLEPALKQALTEYYRVDTLEEKLIRLDTLSDSTEEAAFIRDEILPGMGALRAAADEAETQTAAGYWPFPTYGDLLFGVK